MAQEDIRSPLQHGSYKPKKRCSGLWRLSIQTQHHLLNSWSQGSHEPDANQRPRPDALLSLLLLSRSLKTRADGLRHWGHAWIPQPELHCDCRALPTQVEPVDRATLSPESSNVLGLAQHLWHALLFLRGEPNQLQRDDDWEIKFSQAERRLDFRRIQSKGVARSQLVQWSRAPSKREDHDLRVGLLSPDGVRFLGEHRQGRPY